jgi:hypothetical protein
VGMEGIGLELKVRLLGHFRPIDWRFYLGGLNACVIFMMMLVFIRNMTLSL